MFSISKVSIIDGVYKGLGTFNGSRCLFRNNELLIGTFPNNDYKRIDIKLFNDTLLSFYKEHYNVVLNLTESEEL